MNSRNLEAFLGVELPVPVVQFPAALRNDADPPPSPISHLKDLSQKQLCLQVPGVGDDALVRILDPALAFLQLDHRPPNPIEQIERFKPRNHNRNSKLFC